MTITVLRVPWRPQLHQPNQRDRAISHPFFQLLFGKWMLILVITEITIAPSKHLRSDLLASLQKKKLCRDFAKFVTQWKSKLRFSECDYISHENQFLSSTRLEWTPHSHSHCLPHRTEINDTLYTPFPFLHINEISIHKVRFNHAKTNKEQTKQTR